MKNDAKECHCFIYHAVSPEDRAEATRRLEYSRRIGDQTGMMLMVASLSGKCPARGEDR